MEDIPNKILASITYIGTTATGILKYLSVTNEIIVLLVGLGTLASSVVWIWYVIQKNRREQKASEAERER